MRSYLEWKWRIGRREELPGGEVDDEFIVLNVFKEVKAEEENFLALLQSVREIMAENTEHRR